MFATAVMSHTSSYAVPIQIGYRLGSRLSRITLVCKGEVLTTVAEDSVEAYWENGSDIDMIDN